MTTTTAAPVKVSPRIVRMRRDQLWWWAGSLLWRRGPDTPDGLWMIHRFGRDAVRLVYDPGAPESTALEFDTVMDDARNAERNDAENAYLASLTVAASLPMDELERIKRRVRSGRAGGSKDGEK